MNSIMEMEIFTKSKLRPVWMLMTCNFIREMLSHNRFYVHVFVDYKYIARDAILTPSAFYLGTMRILSKFLKMNKLQYIKIVFYFMHPSILNFKMQLDEEHECVPSAVDSEEFKKYSSKTVHLAWSTTFETWFSEFFPIVTKGQDGNHKFDMFYYNPKKTTEKELSTHLSMCAFTEVQVEKPSLSTPLRNLDCLPDPQGFINKRKVEEMEIVKKESGASLKENSEKTN